MHLLVAKNTLYQLISKIATAGTGFLITILIARDLGVSGYGDFIKVTTYVALFYLFLDFGFNAVYLQIDERLRKFRSLFWGRMILAVAIFFIANIISFLLPYQSQSGIGFSPVVVVGIFIFSFSFFTESVIRSASAVFQKKLDYKSYMVIVVFGSLVNLFLIYNFLQLGGSLFHVLLSFVIGSLCSVFFALTFIKADVFPLKVDFKFIKELWSRSWPLGLTLIFSLIYCRADVFLLSLFKTSEDVGLYGLSYKFFDFFIALPLFLSNALYPLLLKNKKNIRKFRSLVRVYLVVFSLSGIFLIIPVWFISPLFSLIKPEYLGAVLPFRILLLSLPVFFVTSFLQWILISLEKQKFLMYLYLLSALLNIFLNLLLIPSYSYIASAIITGVTELFIMLVLLFKMFNLRIFLEQETENERN